LSTNTSFLRTVVSLRGKNVPGAPKRSTSAQAEARPDVVPATNFRGVAPGVSRGVAPGISRGVSRGVARGVAPGISPGIEKTSGNAIKNPSIAPADKSSSVAGDATRKNLSKAIMLAAGRSATAKTRRVPAKELAPGFAASFPAMMPIASDTGTRPAFPREAIPALRLHFQSSRAEYVERRLNPHNEGVIELYCKLCLRLIVASRDEFVFPIAVKAHKCGRNTRSSMRRW
jgi:hypothetical protein